MPLPSITRTDSRMAGHPYGIGNSGVNPYLPDGMDTQLLSSTRQSSDATEQLAARAIMNAAELIPPDRVARATLDACRRGEFLVLPHPEVREMYQKKCRDHDRWHGQAYSGHRAGPLISDKESLCDQLFLAGFKWTVLAVVAATASSGPYSDLADRRRVRPARSVELLSPTSTASPTLRPYGRDLGAMATQRHELRGRI